MSGFRAGWGAPPSDSNLNGISQEYAYDDIVAATDGFSESSRLGRGTYGSVYRGMLRDGTEVAVKALAKPHEAGFREEVEVLSRFRHPNLVILMGFARHQRERYLVYELLPGGDVCERLQRDATFTWWPRLTVVLDAALGLSHLHGNRPQVFHRDIKTQNILMDRNGTGKMADFGLALLAQQQDCEAMTVERTSGTIGYADPLYIRTGQVTEKSEVYSFGMVLLEALTRRPPALQHASGRIEYQFAHISGEMSRVRCMVDPRASWPAMLVEQLGGLALRCVQEQEAQRPVFVEIVGQLRLLVREASSLPRPGAPGPAAAPSPAAAAGEQHRAGAGGGGAGLLLSPNSPGLRRGSSGHQAQHPRGFPNGWGGAVAGSSPGDGPEPHWAAAAAHPPRRQPRPHWAAAAAGAPSSPEGEAEALAAASAAASAAAGGGGGGSRGGSRGGSGGLDPSPPVVLDCGPASGEFGAGDAGVAYFGGGGAHGPGPPMVARLDCGAGAHLLRRQDSAFGKPPDEVDPHVSTSASGQASSSSTTSRPRCRFGDTCYLVSNPHHRLDFSHPGDPDWDAQASERLGFGQPPRPEEDIWIDPRPVASAKAEAPPAEGPGLVGGGFAGLHDLLRSALRPADAPLLGAAGAAAGDAAPAAPEKAAHLSAEREADVRRLQEELGFTRLQVLEAFKRCSSAEAAVDWILSPEREWNQT